MAIRNNLIFYIVPAFVLFALCSVLWAIPAPRYGVHHDEPDDLIGDDNEFTSIDFVDTFNNISQEIEIAIAPPDTGLRVPLPQPDNNPLNEYMFFSPFHLNTPPVLKTYVEYDPESNRYEFQNMIGSTPYGPGAYMDINEYINYDLRQEIRNYWKQKGASATGGISRTGSGLIPQLRIGGDVFESIFGSNTIDIRPSGNAELIFGVTHTSNQNYTLPVKQRKITQFNFDENIQLNVLAKVGDKIEFNLNYNTESNFDFDNKMKLKYEGKEDDIIQLLEFGDVTLPLNSSLIVGSQSLFGLKTQLKFGKLMVTAVASEQEAETQTITVTGGAQTTDFYFKADQYEENRHFFIGQFFYNHYNDYLSTLPLVGSPVVISKIEVWRTTVGAATTDNRNIIAFTDLGEAAPQSSLFQYAGGNYPSDNINTLPLMVDSSLIRNISTVSNNLRGLGLTAGVDYEKVENAKLLSPSEYTVNTKLGFISLNSALNADQVLAVAFQYSVIGDNNVYQVGEFSNEVSAPNCIRVKLLKSTTLNTKAPLWKLMMKNVYSLSSYQVASKDFRLNILYTGDEEGIANGFFNTGPQKGIPLIRLMGLDNLNQQQDPYPDGVFDFIDNAAILGGTINATNGRIFFPKVEPFGADLRAVLTDPATADKYAFDSLYTTTKTIAQQFTGKNKYYLEGSYKSSYGSEYHLNAMNIAEGSVMVSAGGIPLMENVDYTVNYSMGTVSIVNEGVLNSGTPITISVENKSSYNLNKKRMFGVSLDYLFNENFTIGATMLNLRERPYTEKVNYGDEPINNVIWGMNFAYKTKVPFVTKLVDLLPFHSTTAESKVQFEGEFAHFIPGHSRAIGKEGTTYIDDFESTKSTIDLRSFTYWTLASTPQGQYDLFPEARPVSVSDNARRKLAYGYNRAKLAWYIIDQLFYNNNNATPSNITKSDQSRPYARAVYETELFPYKEQASTTLSTYMSVMNLAYYPLERGPYNYDVAGAEGLSSGLNNDGTLRDPQTRWGGIMRRMDNTDFESANYEYIEFWMMDPFIENPNHNGGKLYFNLGDISEDILRDGVKFFENGLPKDGSDENVEFTVWGRVPTIQQIVNAFDNDGNARQHQDVGFDGLPDDRERTFFQDEYLQLLNNAFGSTSGAYTMAYDDPSADNYHYFRGRDYDDLDYKILERYKHYNNSEGNSPTDAQSPESYPTAAHSIPDREDVNNDNTLSEDEKYYQYVVNLRPDNMRVGENYITDIYEAVPEPLPDGSRPTTKWYQFRIPIKNPDKVIGNISGFNSIRFLRFFLRDFEEPVICRFATFELVRSDWRTYSLNLMEEGDYLPGQGDGETAFNIATVSYEENSNRIPIPYVLPPGIEREQGYGGTQVYLVNEQSLTMKAVNLADGDARAIYKNSNYDLRQFKKLKMFIHAEDVNTSGELKKGDVTVFIRLGSDFTENYYEYEIPVEITPWGVGVDSTRVWPVANRMEIYLDSLIAVKQRRNMAVREGNHQNNLVPYFDKIGNGDKITVVGMPNLAEVTTIMIGIRNPKKKTLIDGDDMLSKSVEVWINELRLSGFDDKSGFAALGRMRMNLADIGDITFSGTYSTPGFGSLEQSVTERQQATLYSIDFATNIDGGKVLFPEKWKVKVPIHYDYSLNMAIPEYNPLNPDVKLLDDLDTYETKKERDSIKKMTTVMVQRQNINLMNVRKERNFDKPIKIRPWDIENLDFSYSYSEMKSRDVDVEFDNEYRHEGEIGYTFNHNPKNYRPLSNQKWLKSKWLQIIRDFNFYALPKTVTIRTSVSREMNEFKLRPKSQGNIIIDTSYVKSFDWIRNYTLRWDLTQSLKFEYNAMATARIDEPQGLIDTRTERDSIWKCFGDGGRTTHFNQRVDASYQIPINKIPLFSWINANMRYTGSYTHTASPISLAYLGNTIQNSNTLQGSGTINFVTLYNMVPYLKKVNQGIMKNATKKVTIDKNDKKTSSKDDAYGDENSGKDKKGTKDSVKINVGKVILDGTVRLLMMVRNASVSYSEGNGTILPGYMYSPNLFGINFATQSPGFLFVFGGQPDIRKMAASGGWLTHDTLLNSAFQSNYNQTFNIRSSIEPFKDFRIDVTANRNLTKSFSEYFRADADGTLHHYSPMTTGTFSMTFVGLSTFFMDADDVFQNFRNIRQQMAGRISKNNPYSNGNIDPVTGYPVGYSGIQQEVLTASFLAAYGGRNPDKLDVTTPFQKIPFPNWRLNYTGFTKLKGIKKYFQSLSLLHNYTSTYTVGNYTTNINFAKDIDGNSTAVDALGNFIPEQSISQIAISEQFSPLIGFDMTLKNSLLFKIEYKKSRNVSLSFTNNQITDVTANELVISSGYRFKDLKLGFVFSGMKRQIVSDLNIALGFGLKDNRTTLRKIEENVDQVTAGMLVMSINVSADYQISKMVGLRFYYDHIINKPYITYSNTNIDCGISVRLMLSQ